MATHYSEVLCPQVIYIFRILDENHKGCLKIGMSKLAGDDIDVTNLPENSDILKEIAKKRIDDYTGTAAVQYELLHTECSLFFKGSKLGAFDDHQVHEILLRSGIKKKEFTYTDKAKEWFITDLQTVKNAIAAAKEGHKSLLPSEMSTDKSPIEFRPEQRLAIDKSVAKFQKPGTRMLWNCKMRFGKTLSTLQVIKEMQFNRTLIVTHRPVVDDQWFQDYDKIFYDQPHYRYGSKNNGEEIEDLLDGNNSFIYFASMQDLRGSAEVGGNFEKNQDILATKWDLLVIDEAHEGTQTILGQKVLKKLQKKNTCVINLSGTPFNIVADYQSDEIVNWTYVDEQREKEKWEEEHPCDHNPYGGLPKMNMAIYDLNEVFDNYEAKSGDVQFNFREFFRVWTGNPVKDGRRMPSSATIGKFIHEKDVNRFLDLLAKPDERTNYPFSTKEYQNIFRHTFWVLPGVAAAKALSELLKAHEVFGMFEIVNVAGEGDDDSDNEEALDAVNAAIGENPEETRTITLSCGRLTTGVSVKAWTAVFMLYGATKTKAQGYMQTIFRVQTPAVIGGKRKEECYVFDFAPDRILTAIDECIRAESYSKGTKLSAQKATITEEEREQFEQYLKYCSVIAFDGSRMRPYDVTQLLEHLKRVQIERVVRNGFEDDALYNNEILMNLDDSAIEELEDIKGIIGTSKASGKTGDFTVNEQGLDGDDDVPEKPTKPGKELTEAEKTAKKELARKKKQKKDAISILRGISIRFPMMIYGADVKDEEEGVTLDNFTSFIDKESWKEFMPEGITMQKFYALRKYYDPDVFCACGKRIRNKARAADELPPLERIHRIEDILSTFRNPDKETVITPWRVVNMHLSDTIGGYDFYDEEHQIPVDEPRYVDRGRPTYKIFEKEEPHILEINSKSGRYPLYMTYSIYRERLKQWGNAGLLEDPEKPTIEEQIAVWDDVVTHNIFVLCKTPMAAKITKRTLVGYRDVPVRARCIDDLVEKIKENKESIIKKVKQGKAFWRASNETDMIQFDAIVGNPPYQIMDGGSKASASPVYQHFVDLAKSTQAYHSSIIMPSKWFAGGKGLDDFREDMRKDRHIRYMKDFVNAKDCFPTASIGGGICYFLWDSSYNDKCKFINVLNGRVNTMERFLDAYPIIVRYNPAINILRKVVPFGTRTLSETMLSRNPFGLGSSERGKEKEYKNSVALFTSEGVFYTDRSKVTDNTDYIDKWKVIISKVTCEHAGEPDKNGQVKLLSSLQVLPVNQVCTDSYLVLSKHDTEEEAKNMLSYMATKFTRFLVLLAVSSINLSKDKFQFVSLQEFSRPWTDKDLYEKYNLTQEEIDYIESLIKPI